jgi:uncharacterized membrane protein
LPGVGLKVNKHNASLILVGAVVVLFFAFIVVAGFFAPDAGTEQITDPQAKAMVDSMAAMLWWMTVATVVLPIMMILVVIAAYLFITEDRPSWFIRAAPSEKVKEATDPADILDLRYARGEITRDQYMAMRTDMKGARA